MLYRTRSCHRRFIPPMMYSSKSNANRIINPGSVTFRHPGINAKRVQTKSDKFNSPDFMHIIRYSDGGQSNGGFRRGSTICESAILTTGNIYCYPYSIFTGTYIANGIKARRTVTVSESNRTDPFMQHLPNFIYEDSGSQHAFNRIPKHFNHLSVTTGGDRKRPEKSLQAPQYPGLFWGDYPYVISTGRCYMKGRELCVRYA